MAKSKTQIIIELRNEISKLRKKLKAKDTIIAEFVRHKHNCFMGEYNTIIRSGSKGCDCGLSKAMEGQDE